MKDPLEDKISQPAVTILMASYGRLEFLKDAVNSALEQNYPSFQILIVDDGSEHAVIEWWNIFHILYQLPYFYLIVN